MVRNVFKTDWSLAHWQAHLAGVYGPANGKRHASEVYGRMTETLSGLARGVRDSQDLQITHWAPRALAWLLGLSTKMEVGLEESLWTFYPGVCPHCRKEKDCRCIIGRTDAARLADPEDIASFQDRFEMPNHLDDWLAMFRRIYHSANLEVGVLKCLAHVQEEQGEVHEALRHAQTTKSLSE